MAAVRDLVGYGAAVRGELSKRRTRLLLCAQIINPCAVRRLLVCVFRIDPDIERLCCISRPRQSASPCCGNMPADHDRTVHSVQYCSRVNGHHVCQPHRHNDPVPTMCRSLQSLFNTVPPIENQSCFQKSTVGVLPAQPDRALMRHRVIAPSLYISNPSMEYHYCIDVALTKNNLPMVLSLRNQWVANKHSSTAVH